MSKKDPSGTTFIRIGFYKDFKRRVKKIASYVNESIYNVDTSNPEDVKRYINVLEKYIDAVMFQQTFNNSYNREYWYKKYIEQSYEKGLKDGVVLVEKIQYNGVQGIDYIDFISYSADVDSIVNDVEEQIKGVNTYIITNTSRLLLESTGDVNKKEVKKLLEDIYSNKASYKYLLIVNDSSVRSHHWANFYVYSEHNIDKVYFQIETAEDKSVCKVCAGLENRFFKLKDTKNMIPVHPNCRCMIIPTRKNN